METLADPARNPRSGISSANFTLHWNVMPYVGMLA